MENKLLKNIDKELMGFSISIMVGYVFEFIFNKNTYNFHSTNVEFFYGFAHVILNNSVCFLVILLTYFMGRSFDIIFYISNGFLLGISIGLVHNFLLAMIFILPHGVVEYYGFFFTSYLVNLNRKKKISPKQYLFCYLILLLAALIEVLITPKLVSIYMK